MIKQDNTFDIKPMNNLFLYGLILKDIKFDCYEFS